MASSFRYRYVDFGTVFTGDPQVRAAGTAAETPATLFANELATDVGGSCWGSNEPLAVIDHHFSGDGQFPSASAAVLHKAQLIRDRFGQQEFDVLWLVTHKSPDFDALCSMYLARWIIESPDAAVDWEAYGLHPDGWLDLPQPQKPTQRIDWFNPDLRQVPPEHRWPLLLASFASVLDSRRRISCPRRRALHSVLYAALKRGRDYMSETSGATEFFDEVRASLLQHNLNPTFDSVLEGSAVFAPELAMLDRESEAYERDLRRARKSIVYLPQSEAPSPKFFKSPKQVALLQEQDRSAEVDAEHLLLADTFRIPTSGIYLRDPESLLFQEWARLDLENSSLGAGFEFTAIAASDGRPAGSLNHTDYVFSIDPERSNGRHLYTVWSRLQTKEVEALQGHEQPSDAPVAFYVAPGTAQRTAAMETLLADPWFGGPNSPGTAVRTPNHGTVIGPSGTRSDLRDDTIVEEVRTELENPVYSADSLVVGPQVTVADFSASKNYRDDPSRKFDLNAALQIPPPQQSYFRFASIRLRADVPILSGDDSGRGLAEQIGDTLWQVLYPEQPGSKPSDFTEHYLVVASDSVGVWGDRGIAVAQKYSSSAGAASPADGKALSLRVDFAGIVSLARDIDQLSTDAATFSDSSKIPIPAVRPSAENNTTASLEAIVSRGGDLTRRAAHIKHNLALPDHDLLRRFSEGIALDQLLATLHDLDHAAAEHLRRLKLAEQAKLIEQRDAAIAKLRSRLEWLEVFTLGFFAPEITEALTRLYGVGNTLGRVLILLSGPVVAGLAALILKPWKRKPDFADDARGISLTILGAVIAACVVAWLAGLLHILAK